MTQWGRVTTKSLLKQTCCSSN